MPELVVELLVAQDPTPALVKALVEPQDLTFRDGDVELVKELLELFGRQPAVLLVLGLEVAVRVLEYGAHAAGHGAQLLVQRLERGLGTVLTRLVPSKLCTGAGGWVWRGDHGKQKRKRMPGAPRFR